MSLRSHQFKVQNVFQYQWNVWGRPCIIYCISNCIIYCIIYCIINCIIYCIIYEWRQESAESWLYHSAPYSCNENGNWFPTHLQVWLQGWLSPLSSSLLKISTSEILCAIQSHWPSPWFLVLAPWSLVLGPPPFWSKQDSFYDAISEGFCWLCSILAPPIKTIKKILNISIQ